MAAKKHHCSVVVNFLGPSAKLLTANLPTLQDILKQCQLLRERSVSSRNVYNVSDMASDVLPLILNVWNRANAKLVQCPIRLSDDVLKEKIKRKWTTLTNIAGKNAKVPKRERAVFLADLDKLFNILVCGCSFTSCDEAKCSDENCPDVHINCSCPRESRIPKLELAYLKDQREKVGRKGRQQIGTKDQKETAAQAKALKRKQEDARRADERESKQRKNELELAERVEAAKAAEEAEEAEAEAAESADGRREEVGEKAPDVKEESMAEIKVDPSFQNEWIDRKIRAETHQQNRTPLPTVASIAIRGEESRRFAAAIATATLVDYKIITPDNKSQIITKDKIQREIDRLSMANSELKIDDEKPVICVLFDGRMDKTKVMLADDRGKLYPSTVTEEHVSLVAEPGSEYLGHLAPSAKDAKTQAEELFRFFVAHGIDETILYIGGDSTAVNTGAKGGIMHLLELHLGHRLMRIVCELHTNELPFRHIVEELDGPTTGPHSYAGWSKDYQYHLGKENRPPCSCL